MDYIIETWQAGKQLLGSDFSTIVRRCSTLTKLDKAITQHKKKVESLKKIKPFLNSGYTVKVENL